MADKSYSQMILLDSFEERLRYLTLDGRVGQDTFGFDRYLNQALYHSNEWKKVRREVIIRDQACDLGVEGYEINNHIFIHHINPITADDIIKRSSIIFDLDNLVCTSKRTHTAIHFSDERIVTNKPIIRLPNDTCPWR